MAFGLRSMRRIGPVGMALTLGQIAWVVREHWQAIPADRRARLQELLRKAKGRPSNLSDAERVELRELMRGLNLTGLARRSATAAALGRRLRPPA